jgi:hypothetical protein
MRTIQDADLATWEVYASSGDFGFPERSKIVFHCLSDLQRRARAVTRDLDRAAVEHEIAALPDPDLAELLARADDLT